MIRLVRFYLTQRNRFHLYRLRLYVWALRKYIKEKKPKVVYLTNQIGFS